MTNKNKLPVIGNKYKEITLPFVIKAVNPNWICVEFEGILKNDMIRTEDFFTWFEELPDQEPANHFPDAKEKVVGKVQEALLSSKVDHNVDANKKEIMNKCTVEQITDYEIKASLLAHFIPFDWVATFLAWKVKRKYNRYVYTIELMNNKGI